MSDTKLYRSEDVQHLIDALRLVDPRDSFVFDNDSDDVRDAIQNALEAFAKVEPVSVPEINYIKADIYAYQEQALMHENERRCFMSGIKFENDRIRKAMEGK